LAAQNLIPTLMFVCAILTFVVGYLTFSRNRDKDVKNDASKLAVIETKIDTISQGIDSIRIDTKANEKQIIGLSERITRVEESSKSAHKRLDILEGKGGNAE
jgi:hypothetical protein